MKREIQRLILVLLVTMLGGISTWAQQTQVFNVVYDGRTTTQGAGYTANTTDNISYTYRGQSRTVKIQEGYTQESFTVTGTYASTNSDYYASQLVNFITPKNVSGFVANVTVSGTTVTIKYSAQEIRYRVVYDKTFVPGGGYTITNANMGSGSIVSGDDSDILVIRASGTNAPTEITSDNLNSHLEAKAVDGYNASLYFAGNEAQLGYLGTIYVNYETTATPVVWNDGVYEYSTVYTRNTHTVINMPEGECAISLYLGNSSEEVTDAVTYRVYRDRSTTHRIQIGWNSYTVYYLYDLVGDEYRQRTDVYYSSNYGYIDSQGNQFDQVYPLCEDGTRLNGTQTEATYDGGAATYVFQSVDTEYWYYENEDDEYLYHPYTYNVTHSTGTSKLKNAVIPLVDPTYGKKVTAIQKWGFCYKKNDTYNVYNCEIATNGTVVDANGDGKIDENDRTNQNNARNGYIPLVNDHSNDYLETVTFQKDANGQSNLESIGDYAFMSCLKLTDIDIPFSVVYLGQGLFEMDRALKNVNFQTGQIEVDGVTYNEGVQFNTIRNFTFWCCTAIETLVLPDGITDIEGQTSGASLQYMTSLKNLSLPNTLKRVGPHFLCSCSSLETLTIPVSVIYIDGASFHGCESLKSVYILGPAAALQGEFAEGDSDTASSTFSANTTLCKEAVNNCTFYTTYENYPGYANDPVWGRIDNNGEYDPANGKFGNTLTRIPDTKRTLMPNVWVTAIFPYGVENYKTTFGEKTIVAKMDQESEVEYKVEQFNGKATRMYSLKFTPLTTDNIPANLPVMIKPEKKTEYTFYTAEQTQTEYFQTEAKLDHGYSVDAKDGAKITMKGHYLDYKMFPYDFYFLYKNKKVNEQEGGYEYDENEVAKFYRVPDADNAATIKACRCFWTISVDGLKTGGEIQPASQIFFDQTTGIDDVKLGISLDGVYDLQGRKINADINNLPKGIYIVNGKKMAVN